MRFIQNLFHFQEKKISPPLNQPIPQEDNHLIIISEQIRQIEEKQNQLMNELIHLKNIITVSTDISKTPAASGDLKLIQECALILLKKLDKICKSNHIQYWMDFGSLLGTIRHQGFIPWDDDMDVSMLREDYEKLLPILETEFTQDGFHYSTGDIIRLFYKGIPAQVDIFPYDRGSENEAPEMGSIQEKELSDKMWYIHTDLIKPDWSRLETMEDTIPRDKYSEVRSLYTDVFLEKKEPAEKGYLFPGLETFPPQRAIFQNDWVFPLQKASFEGLSVLVPNNTHLFLKRYYHNYMAFPIDCYPKHPSIMGRLNTQSIIDMQNLIKKEYSK